MLGSTIVAGKRAQSMTAVGATTRPIEDLHPEPSKRRCAWSSEIAFNVFNFRVCRLHADRLQTVQMADAAKNPRPSRKVPPYVTRASPKACPIRSARRGTDWASTSRCSRRTRRESSCVSSMQPGSASSSASRCPNTPTRSGTAICPMRGPVPCTRYRVHGPYAPEQGHRFNPNKLVLDPYAKALVGELKWADELFGYQIGADRRGPHVRRARQRAVHAEVPRRRSCFHLGPRAPAAALPWDRTIIYEAHVRGYTMRHPAVPTELRGKFAGLACAKWWITSAASASRRSSCCRCRRPIVIARSRRQRAHELLGLRHDRVLRAQSALFARRDRSRSSRRWLRICTMRASK